MTGFAREHGDNAFCSWTWELKSVNGKARDVRCRLPSGCEGLEVPVREALAKAFGRGSFNVLLTVSWAGTLGGYRVNRDVLDQVIALVPEIQEKVPSATPPSIDGLLGLRGVIEAVESAVPEDDRESLNAELLKGLKSGVASLSAMRAEEGARMQAVLGGQLDEIERLHVAASALASTQPEAIRERLNRQVADLVDDTSALDAERLAQEAAIIMTKADIREELDRLVAHIAAARDYMAAKGPVGRKLDFLCQEFNREANTLCSKSWDKDLTGIGLDLKTVIDQFREQVQNIE